MRENLNENVKIEIETKQGPKKVFEILSVIGLGATCIVYNACFYDEYNIRHYVKIKECCPLSSVIGRQNDCVIWTTEDERVNAFEAFEKMYTQHVKLQELFDIVNTTCKVVDTLYYGNNTVYLIMESDNGASFENAVPGTLFEILQALYALSNTIGKYHEIGFLHLDIKPQNFMVIPETKELVKLFDFDSLVSLNDISLGIAENISYSNEWAAPEVRQKKIKNIKETADVYSVGTILFFALYGRTIDACDKVNFGKYNLEKVDVVKKVNPLIKRKINSFFTQTLNPVIKKRYQNMNAVKTALREMLDIADPSRNYLCSVIPSQINYFSGRENELEQARKILGNRGRVLITGMGGIGKSEFSKRFANQYKDQYSVVVWVECGKCFADTISSTGNFIIANGANEKVTQDSSITYKEKILSLLSVIDEQTLIIIDNVKDFTEKALLDFLKFPCNIMITTRNNTNQLLSDFTAINLGCMDIVECRKVFNHYYKFAVSGEESEAVNRIIMQLGRYTLLIPIVAKQMTASSIRPFEMLKKLLESGFSSSSWEKVQHFKDETLVDEVLIGHLKNVFDVSEMNAEKLLVLRVLSLLGNIEVGKIPLAAWCGFRRDYEYVLKYEPFLDTMLDRVDLSVINAMINSGWIQYDEFTDRISIHDVVAELIKSEYAPDYSNCKPFFTTMIKVAEDIEGWKRELDADDLCWYINVNEYLADMYLAVIQKSLDILQIDSVDAAEMVVNILEKVYRVYPEQFIEYINELIRNNIAYASPENIMKLRKMQVFAYFYRYNLTYYETDGSIDKGFAESKITNATAKLKESVKDIRKYIKKPMMYTALVEIFDGPKYLCDNYGGSLFDEKKEYVSQYRYMLRILNEIVKYADEDTRDRAVGILNKLKNSHKDWRAFLKWRNTPSTEKNEEKDKVDLYSEALAGCWNNMQGTFDIISSVMKDEEITIQEKICSIIDAGYNPQHGWFSLQISLSNEKNDTKREELLSSVELEVALFIRDMWSIGLFNNHLSIADYESMQKSIYRQCLYSKEYMALIQQLLFLINKIKSHEYTYFFWDIKIREFQLQCKELEYFGLDVLALWLYRTVEENFNCPDVSKFSIDSMSTYSSFIHDAIYCAERLGDFDAYYYFMGRRRDILKVDFAFNRDIKPDLDKNNNTLKKWEEYIQRMEDAECEEDIDALYSELLNEYTMNSKAKELLLNTLEEKTTLKRLRLWDIIPVKCIPDEKGKQNLERKHFIENNGTIIELIDDYGEIIFQSVLIYDYEKAKIWIRKYINLITMIRDADQDTIFVGRYLFLPSILSDFAEDDFAEEILKAMIENWLDYSTEKYNSYELKTNEAYLDYIYNIAASTEQKEKYNKIKESLNNDSPE